jgi:hypothetical protein
VARGVHRLAPVLSKLAPARLRQMQGRSHAARMLCAAARRSRTLHSTCGERPETGGAAAALDSRSNKHTAAAYRVAQPPDPPPPPRTTALLPAPARPPLAPRPPPRPSPLPAHHSRNTTPLRRLDSAATAAAVSPAHPALAWLLASPARTVNDAFSRSTPCRHHFSRLPCPGTRHPRSVWSSLGRGAGVTRARSTEGEGESGRERVVAMGGRGCHGSQSADALAPRTGRAARPRHPHRHHAAPAPALQGPNAAAPPPHL